MNKYNDIKEWDSLGELEVVSDFLPKPKDLVLKSRLKKVTISLSEEVIVFFKKEAKKFKVPYQPMIRTLLDQYVRAMK